MRSLFRPISAVAIVRIFLGVISCLSIAGSVNAQLLYSFETGLDGFVPQGAADSDYINHVQSPIGATEGTMALEIETGTSFGRDVVVNEGPGNSIYDIFNTVAANPAEFTLDFDVTFTADSWSSLQDPGSFFQINVFSNSDSSQGFTEAFGVVNGNPGSASFVNASLPASQISLLPDSSFFQLGFGTNSNHTDGLGGEGVKYYVDNVRFSPVPMFNEEILFSWETPDDPGTPGVNEQFEGWGDGFPDADFFHTRSIETSEGVTDGASALRFSAPQSGFAWGSQFIVDSGEEGDPANQPLVDDLVSKVNSADRIAFDVTFPDDPGFNTPTFLSLFLNVSDNDSFYQSPAKQAGNPVTSAGETITIEVPLSELTDGGMSIADQPLTADTFFRFALASNADDAVDFIVDNFRVLSLDSPALPGDANGDGVVDLLDLDILGANFGIMTGNGAADGDFNEDGTVDLLDLDILGNNFGAMAASSQAIPEAAAGALAVVGLSLAGFTRRRSCVARG